MKDELKNQLLDKLAGELSENEAAAFENELKQSAEDWEDYQFFQQAWEDLGGLTTEEPPSNLSAQFYARLEQEEEKIERQWTTRLKNIGQLLQREQRWVAQGALGFVLVVCGFLIGGQWNKKTIHLTQNTTINQISPEPVHQNNVQRVAYVSPATKIQQIRTINASSNQSIEEAVRQLTTIIQNERNTNVKLAALFQLNEQFGQQHDLRQFYVQQLRRESSPLVQAELLNMVMDQSKSRESLHTLENMLDDHRLNPMIEQKIKNDLPVLRASY